MRIWDTDKKTVIFVTHNISEAILLADRVVAMSPRPGRIAKLIDIDLPRPRTIDMEFTSMFKSYSDQIREVIYHGPGAKKVMTIEPTATSRRKRTKSWSRPNLRSRPSSGRR